MSSVPAATPETETAARQRRLQLYLGGQASWFISLGIQFVIFPFLVTQVLHEPAARVGIAQMSLMAPSLLFMLLGGTVADHSDARRILIRVHLFATVPPLLLATVYLTGHLTYAILIVYALAMGTLAAFAIPARDSALTRVAETNIQQAVTLAMGVQMGSQLVGMLIAALAAITGTPALLFFQAAVMLAGFWAAVKLAPLPPTNLAATVGRFAQIVDGLKSAAGIPIVATVIALNFAVGLFYVGSFLVVLPLMIRDIYQSTSSEFTLKFALINICFWGGTIVVNLALLRIGHIGHRGRLMMGSLASGLIILALFHFHMPFWLVCLLVFWWGMGAGTTMTMGRTIVQMAAPESHRARVLSAYQLGFSGGAPLGALMMGLLVGWLGIFDAVLVPATIMVGILALLYFLSPIWSYKAAAD
ncbi:major facilitator superfamily MFS_1 [Parvibaculum lavamentivorans DS-1]|uniref:Major facilitator superfamily MFS_1 n=1 Tax=Parvibaculum lavamentivorans (strain DS-1 / DSM 13023 / NCIMB 13966) TaxID=402881 RepID=A7HRE4_PARL1|nr:MFS transporter [Parvibaculum lavamentivorans]ABS62477.1 major facilitator superfamily MFS_1 [Parvibaculum lavamentivorans DS-1]